MHKECNRPLPLNASDLAWAMASISMLTFTYACVLLLVVAIAYGMWWGVTNLGGKAAARLLLLLSLALYTSIRTLIWRAPPPVGIPMQDARLKRLRELLEREARLVCATSPNSVWLTPDATIGVYEEAPILPRLKSHKTALVGIIALDWLTVGELRSLVAHEFAHLSRMQPRLIRFASGALLRIFRAVEGMRFQTALWWLSPTWWLLRLLMPVCALASYGVIKRYELNADAIAAQIYGSDILIAALQKYALIETLFDGVIHEISGKLALEGKSLTDLVKSFRELCQAQLSPDVMKQMTVELTRIPSSPLALHISIGERLAKLERIALCATTKAAHELTMDQPASSLLTDAKALSEELSLLYSAAIHSLISPTILSRRWGMLRGDKSQSSRS